MAETASMPFLDISRRLGIACKARESGDETAVQDEFWRLNGSLVSGRDFYFLVFRKRIPRQAEALLTGLHKALILDERLLGDAFENTASGMEVMQAVEDSCNIVQLALIRFAE